MKKLSTIFICLLPLATSGCSPDLNSVIGIEDGKLDSFTCEMVINEINYVTDAVNDANDYYDFMALEIVFDMAGDAFDIYATGEAGEAGSWLRRLADKADAAGDAFGDEEIGAEATVARVEKFINEAKNLRTYCG